MKKLALFLIILFSPLTCFAAVQWFAGTGTAPITSGTKIINLGIDSAAYGFNPLDRVLTNFKIGQVLTYASASTLTVTAGEIVVSDGSTVKLMLQNTSNTTVTWANIDAGAEAASTTYYVYAVAATTSDTSATYKISLSATSPSGSTYYKKIGSFYNNSSSDIDSQSITQSVISPTPTDSSGNPIITNVRDFGTSSSAYTLRTGALKIAYGNIAVSGESTASISNLPFTSSSSYKCFANDPSSTTSDVYPVKVTNASASAITIYNTSCAGCGTTSADWFCIGI